MKKDIIHNLQVIHSRMQTAISKSNRNHSDVRLLLATKTVGFENILFALQQGENLVGENKVQELKSKCNSIAHLSPEVHFIGHLQSNKIKEIIKWVTCIQSIDRFKIAEKLNQRLLNEGKTIDIYIQVNTSKEESKFGVYPSRCLDLVKEISELSNVNIKGLMTIGKFNAPKEEIKECFKVLRLLKEKIETLNLSNVEMKELSMGMSGDLEIAIEEGATIIRVGSAIFGDRIYPDSYYWNEGTYRK